MIPSLRAIKLRKKKRKREKFKRRVSSRWYKFRQRATIFLCVLCAGAAVYWTQTGDFSFFKNDDVPLSEVEEFSASAVLAQKDDISTRDLLYLAEKMERDLSSPLPVQMNWVEERIEISNRLLSKPDDELAQKEGTLYRIEALQLLSNLNRKFQLGRDSVDDQLTELCAANLNHSDPEISKIAAVAVMMTSIHQFATEPNKSNQREALKRCTQVCSQLNDDVEIAVAIYRYARLMKRSNLMVDDSVEFFNVIIEQFADSSNKKAQGFALGAYNEILFGDESAESKFSNLLASGIKDRFRQKRRTVGRELTSRIQYSLRAEMLSSAAIDQIVNLLEVLVSIDNIAEVRELLAETQQYFASLDGKYATLATEAKSKLDAMEQRVGLHQRQFVLDGLEQFGAESSDFEKRLSLVLYWDPQDTKSTRMLTSITNLSYQEIVQCIVVLTRNDEESLLIAEKLAKEIPGFKFTQADVESAVGREFESQFPIPFSPYLVLLNEQHQIVAINPEFRDLGRQIQTLLN